MDALLLSRWQFAITAAFHFIFPSFTIGLSLVIFTFFLIFFIKKDDIYRKIGNLLVKIFAVGFAVGVATGIVMEFQFGTNWAEFSKRAGGIFGGPLAIEAMVAFFLESSFLSILVFAEKKVSPLVRLISSFLVMLGTFISGFWILTALNWMQIPTGFKIEGSKIILTDFWAIIFNQPNIIRFLHTIVACFIAGSLLVMGISSYKILKNKQKEIFTKAFRVSSFIFLIFSLIQPFLGTLSGEYVAKHQPLKLAIMEAKWQNEKPASEPIIALIDQKNMTNIVEISIPGLLSMLAYHDPQAEFKGIKQLIDEYNIKKEELPNIPLTFWSFRGMVGLGFMFIAIGILSVLLFKNLEKAKWLLWLIVFTIPTPIIANWLGWIVTEHGRQPWVIYGLLKTKGSVSNLSTPEVTFTLFTFVGIYLLLFILWTFITIKIISKGIDD
ncbi:MAG: cytochrome ubiquinol oxidase subunit I [Brevinematia bacterium]